MFNVYVQPYGYDRPSTLSCTFLITPSQLTLFYLPFLRCLAARAALPGFGLWATCPPNSVSYFQGYLLSSNSSPSWSTL